MMVLTMAFLLELLVLLLALVLRFLDASNESAEKWLLAAAWVI